jgi:hypothetical protein
MLRVLTPTGQIEVNALDVTAIERTLHPHGHPWKHATVVHFIGSERHGTCYVAQEFTQTLWSLRSELRQANGRMLVLERVESPAAISSRHIGGVNLNGKLHITLANTHFAVETSASRLVEVCSELVAYA